MTPRAPAVRSLAALGVLLAAAAARASEDNLENERTVCEVVQTERMLEDEAAAPERAGGAVAGEGGSAEEEPRATAAEERAAKRSWALLPQVGYSPERGPHGGVKFTDRDVRGMTLDVAALIALKRQFKAQTSLVAPSLLGMSVIGLLGGTYATDPTKEFFGLGNNDVGPDAISTHELTRTNVALLFAMPLRGRWLAAASWAYNDVEIERGRIEGDTPPTVELFPELPGIRGGLTSPLAFSLLYNSRRQMARPERGWSVMARVERVDDDLGSDFDYTRAVLDASYLYPLLNRRQILGLRLGGEYVDAKRGQVPFYELAALGGSRDLRGYFLDRFLGTSKMIASLEYRLKLLDFDFYELYRVRVDGVAFGDAGRVFIDREELEKEFHLSSEFFERVVDDFQYSYGGGVRIALGEALIARIDVGFSEEETGLLYLTFGHTF